jgi:hypothetical protein
MGDDATEEAVKALKSPRAVLFVTHGIFEKVDPSKVCERRRNWGALETGNHGFLGAGVFREA